MKDLNLIPKSYIIQKRNRSRRLQLIAALTVVFALFVFSVIIPLLYSYSLTQKKNLLDVEIKSGSGYALTLGQLTTIKNLYLEREKESAKISDKTIKLSELLTIIEKAAPDELFVLNLNMSDDAGGESKVAINGGASSMDEIASFVNHLRATKAFSDVVVSAVKRNESEVSKDNKKVYFNYSMTLYLKNRDVVK